MSVLIKDMEKPKSCYAVIDGESEYCPFVNTDDDCVLLFKKGICEETWEEQYSKCPLVEVTEPCEDAVSREAVIEEIKVCFNMGGCDCGQCNSIIEHINSLPPVTPKPKTGKWIDQKGGGCCCSECGRYALDEVDGNFIHVAAKSNFCPNCGAEMEVKSHDSRENRL